MARAPVCGWQSKVPHRGHREVKPQRATTRASAATKARIALVARRVSFGLDQATGMGTAKHAKHANAGCCDLAASLTLRPGRRAICVFCGFPWLASMQSPACHDPCRKPSSDTARYGLSTETSPRAAVIGKVRVRQGKQLLQDWHDRFTSSYRAKARYPCLCLDQHCNSWMPGLRPA